MKSKRFFSILLACALLVGMMQFTASATTSSSYASNVNNIGYDYSSEDDINIYDTYEKTTKDGIVYVETGKQNVIDLKYPDRFEDFRYGSYLRSAEERQYFSVYNLDYKTAICSNVLTIYADPEVDFVMNDFHNQFVMNSAGEYDKSKVRYYNKSTDNGHNVYYIELIPVEPGFGVQIMEFSTTSTTTQPHFSFWYGHPLVKSASVRGGILNLSITAPNSTSSVVTVSSPYSIPERAWITKVTVSPDSVTNASAVTGAYLQIQYPDNGSHTERPNLMYFTPTSNTVFKVATIGYPYASPARGKYKFNLRYFDWSSSADRGTAFFYTGRVSFEYLYAFGA